MPDLHELFDRSARAAGTTVYWTTRAARLMVGVPDYETYVAHRRASNLAAQRLSVMCYRLDGSTETDVLSAPSLSICKRAYCSFPDPSPYPSPCWPRWRSR